MHRYFRFYIIFLGIVSLALLCGIAKNAIAQITPGDEGRALRSLQQTEQNQQNQMRELQRQQEQKERERKKPKLVVPVPKEKNLKGGACYTVHEIRLIGATVLKGKGKEKIIAPYRDSCMSVEEINQLMHKVTNYYMDHGYVTTRVAIPQQDLKSGILEIQVMEGTVEGVLLNGDTWRDRLQAKMAFPPIIGKLLNLRDIEQGLDQLNRLSSSNATMQLVPGKKEGGTIIVVTNTPHKETRLSLGFDNSGQSSTGKNKGLIGIERDNLFGLGEAWHASFNKDTDTHNGMRGSDIAYGNVSVPFGYWTLSATANRSDYITTIIGTNQSFKASGVTNSATAKLERVIFRNQDSKLSLNSALKVKDTQAFIEDAKNISGTYLLSMWDAGTDYTLRALGTMWNVSAGYERGLDGWWGAKRDPEDITGAEPHAQYNKYLLDMSAYKPFIIGEKSFIYRSSISGQYSPDHLYSSERIGIGDRYTVRGFQQGSMIGDSGGYFKNEIMWNVPPLIDNSHVTPWITGIQPYLGLDMGTTRLTEGKEAEGGTGVGYMSGWAVGIRSDAEFLAFDLGYSRAIKAPSFIEKTPQEIYFTISAKWGF